MQSVDVDYEGFDVSARMELTQTLEKILLIDDDPNDRLLAIRELHREFPDLIFHEALDWDDVYKAFAGDDFDFVITDYELNWTTGLDILRALKQHDPDRPIVMFTNSGTQEIAVEAMKAGLDDYVLKSPKHLIRLSQAVRTVWENAQIRRKASELEFRLQFLLNELNVGVFRTTVDGHLIEASDGLVMLLGVDSFAEAQVFFQDQIALTASERAEEEQWHRDIQITNANNQTRWLQISETRMLSNGEYMIDGIASDITEKVATSSALKSLNRELEQRVAERTSRLESLNRELEMFAFSISHDLRAPIRQIDGFSALLKHQLEATEPDDTAIHYIERIRELTNRSGQMIDDLLQFSRTGRAEMQYITVSMDRLVHEAIRQAQPELAGREVDWKVQSLPTVRGDRNLLGKVWQNLIENAVKYTRDKERAEIEVGSKPGDGETIFYVRDNGIGFSEAEIDKLFGVFQRLSNAKEFDGTGIGLANVQRVIRRHEGRIWAEGETDVGATLYFTIPDSAIVSE